MPQSSKIFEIDSILHANLTGELTFDRSYIRLRRSQSFKTRSWEDIPPVSGDMVTTSPARGWFHVLHWIARRHQLTQLYCQGELPENIPDCFTILSDIQSATNTGGLLMIADSLPVETPPPQVRSFLLLRNGEPLEEELPFEKVWIQIPLAGISTPVLRQDGQNTVFLPPWMAAQNSPYGLQLWDLANPLPHLCVYSGWTGLSPGPRWLVLQHPIHTPKHSSPRQHLPPIEINLKIPTSHYRTCLPLKPNVSPYMQQIRTIFDQLRSFSPERFQEHLHLFNANSLFSSAISSIFSAEFLELEAPYHGKKLLIIPPADNFDELIVCAASYLAQGWQVGLYPCDEQQKLCAILAQIGQDLGLPLALQSEPSTADHIIAYEPLPIHLTGLMKHTKTKRVGRRFHVGWCQGLALQALAWDALVHDGYGTYASSATFCENDPQVWLPDLQEHLQAFSPSLPPGKPSEQQIREKQQRKLIAEKYGQWIEPEDATYSIAVLPIEHFQPVPVYRNITFHHVQSPKQVYQLLKSWRPWLHTFATDEWQTTDPRTKPKLDLLRTQYLAARVCFWGQLYTPHPKDRIFAENL